MARGPLLNPKPVAINKFTRGQLLIVEMAINLKLAKPSMSTRKAINLAFKLLKE